jgi:apolipoprotein N-acyltransferase
MVGSPSVLLGPVDSSSRFVDRYRRISSGLAFVLSATASFGLAIITGLLAGVAGMYLYDRAMSKGDDATLGIGGFFAAGACTFAIVFSWLQNLHHPISSRTSVLAWLICLLPAALVTLLAFDADYMNLIFVAWLEILVFGALTLFVCRRWWHDSEQGF